VSRSRRTSALLTLALGLCLVFAAPAGASRPVTIDAPSRAGFVDVRTALFPTARPIPTRLRANVLLPDGYDARRAYPLLYLLHGAGDGYAAWANPAQGDVRRTLKGLQAIVVMPEGGLGFYSDWYNGGRRGDPAWTRYHLEEVLPLVERRYRIRPGRRWHAIAGLSMGGYGASFLATQLPGYFGTVVPMSGLVSIRRPEIVAGLSLVGSVSYPALWGPADGADAQGHDPVALARNLRFTRVVLRTGDGTPRKGITSPAPQISGGLEAVLRTGNDQFAAALRRAGAALDYRVHEGVHDWPYWRADIAAAAERGELFRPVTQAPTRWSYRTVARSGDAWGLRFRFTAPPSAVVTFTRSGDRLRATGVGRVRIVEARGCALEATLPFSRRLSGGRCRDIALAG
jgi:S-formylglutathione hydrolase FrmB